MYSSLKTTHPVFLATAAIALGCTGEVSDGADADTSSTHALLVVEQSTPIDEAETGRSHASVWFLRVADEQDLPSATKLVAEPRELPALGACAVVGNDEPELPAEMSPVELAFAGDVHMRMGAEATPLTLRFFPDVANLVSGVVYTLQDQDDLFVPRDALITVTASGDSELEPVEASASPPPLPTGLALEGQPLSSMQVEVPRGLPLSLSWTPGGEGDIIFVDVAPIPAVPSERVRCAFLDNGSGKIPTMAIPETAEMRLSIHRTRDVPLRSVERIEGLARFDLAVTTRVMLSSP